MRCLLTNYYNSTTTMVKDIQQKGRLSLAIKAIQNGQITFVREAAKLYNVPESSLRYSLRTNLQTSNLPRTTSKLTKTEENTLVQWIINMDTRGVPPRHLHVQDMANILLSQQNQSGTPSTVGKNWVYKFVRRYPELKTRFMRRS